MRFSQMNWRQSWRFWIGLLLSLLTLIWLIVATDWPSAWQALQGTNYGLVVAAALLNLITIPIRSLRWRFLFPPDGTPPFNQLTAAMLIGQTLNLVAPARLGDFIRASLIKQHPTAFVLGTQVVQSALDLVMLAGLVLVMLFQVSLPDWWRGSGEALLWTTLLALVIITGLLLFRHQVSRMLSSLSRRWPRIFVSRLLQIGIDFLNSLDTFSRPLYLVAALLLSAAIWFIYIITNYVMLLAVTPQATMLAALFVVIVLQLGVAVPSSPGRIGVFHYLGAQALLVFGIKEGAAITFSLLFHFISVIIPVIIGLWVAWRVGVNLAAAPNADPVKN